MSNGMKMLGGVFIFGGIAAADMAADQAQAQVHPAVAHFDAFGADVRTGGGDFHFVQVFTLFRHLSSFERRPVPFC